MRNTPFFLLSVALAGTGAVVFISWLQEWKLKRKMPLLLLALALAAGGVLVFSEWSRNRVVVRNSSGQEIALISLEVCGTTMRLRNIPPDATSGRTFKVGEDSYFTITGRLADGTPIAGTFGYVTRGVVSYRATIVVDRDGSISGRQNY